MPKMNTKTTAWPAATGAEMESGMEGAKQWLDLAWSLTRRFARALSSRRGRIIGRLTEKPATALAGQSARNLSRLHELCIHRRTISSGASVGLTVRDNIMLPGENNPRPFEICRRESFKFPTIGLGLVVSIAPTRYFISRNMEDSWFLRQRHRRILRRQSNMPARSEIWRASRQ